MRILERSQMRSTRVTRTKSWIRCAMATSAVATTVGLSLIALAEAPARAQALASPESPASAEAQVNGCSPAGTQRGTANYRCNIYTTGGAPSQSPDSLTVLGRLPQGNNGFFCQLQVPGKSVYLPNGAKNNWWALPSGDVEISGLGGYVNVVYLSGGSNFGSLPGLPVCSTVFPE
jgi:hypothetical protein